MANFFQTSSYVVTGPSGWNPDADCNGVRAEERMRWLMDNKGLGMDDAKRQVMKEFPCTAGWNPDGNCNGARAEDCMRWLMNNKGLGMDDAKRQVMQQFQLAPQQDTCRDRGTPAGGLQAMVGVFQAMFEGFQAKGQKGCDQYGGKGGFDSSKGYAMGGDKGGYGKGSCDSGKGGYDLGKGDKGGYGKSQDHHEYHPPTSGDHVFGSWNPDADCNGVRAEERMRWLMNNKGLGMDDAKRQVMKEFPRAAGWNPDADCKGTRAEERMRWLMDNKGLSMDDAQGQVMKEFPFVFREGYGRDWWDARADCQGLPAGDRARWLMENEGYSEHAARTRVKTEFPKHFRGGGDHINQGKFPHCMSLVDTPEGPRLKLEVVVNAENVALVAVHYQVNDGAPMNFEMRYPEGGSKTFAHTTPSGGGQPLCRNGDQVSYWLAAKINGLISEEPEGACRNPGGGQRPARMHWTAHH